MHKPRSSLISEGDVRAYQEDGVVCLRGRFKPRWLEVLSKGIERNLANPGWQARVYTRDRGDAQGFFFGDAGVWQDIREYEDFISNSPAAEIAATLMGSSKVNIFFDGVFVKNGGTPSRTPWHQDVPYWPIEGDQMCSVWITLDYMPREDSVEYVKGSHRWNKTYRPKSFFKADRDYAFDNPDLEPMPDFELLRDQYELLGWEMQPGDVQCFHGHIIHGAAGNSTKVNRRAFQARFSGDGMIYAEKQGELHPTFPHCGLKHGDSLDSDTFPVVWTRQQGLLRRATEWKR
ncbi:MAG: phytanoyl-CoA dioxygenase family protein [Gammaproteobacteria bacterium]|nr:phytanoyl-CoA dioxygenase family protein [Gammaproteobacteria bacterium]